MSDVHEQPARRLSPAAAWAGPRWLWFGVLGGTLAWGFHLLAAWGSVELACTHGNAHVGAMPLRGFVAVVTVIPALVTVAAMLVAGRAWSALRTAGAEPSADLPLRRLDRARLMAETGLWLNGLALLMIALGGAGVLTFAACAR